MAGALARRPAFRRWKPDRGAERDPVGVFALDIAAVDQVNGENLVRAVADAGLKPRPGYARHIRLPGLSERLQRQLEYIGEFPIPANAIEQVMSIDGTV